MNGESQRRTLDDSTKARPAWLYPFSRVTSSGAYIPEVDGLRFIAIAMVVLVHIHLYLANTNGATFALPPLVDGHGSTWVLRTIENGRYGVELFFVISGFILALPFAQAYLNDLPPIRLGTYLLRRLTRLEPPYLVAMALVCALTMISNRRGIAAGTAVHSLAASSLYLHWLVFGSKSILNFVTWSLEVEVQFYILVPAIAKVFRISSRWIRRAVIASAGMAFSIAQCWIGFESTPRLFLSVLNFGQYFLAGLFLADLYIGNLATSGRRSAVWDLIALVSWPAMFVLFNHPGLVPWLLAPHIVLSYVSVFRSIWVRELFIAPIITTIGGMCYSIYLLHVPVIAAFGRITQHIGKTQHYGFYLGAQVALLCPLVVLVSALFFRLVERPCMRRDWPQRAQRVLRAQLVGRAD